MGSSNSDGRTIHAFEGIDNPPRVRAILGLFRNLLGRIRKKLQRGRGADSLGPQIASTIYRFVLIRGFNSLFNPEIAIVMCKDSEMCLSQDVEGMKNGGNVMAVVYLKDIESYNQFKEIQSDDSCRNDALARTATDYLANQAARQLLQQIKDQSLGEV